MSTGRLRRVVARVTQRRDLLAVLGLVVAADLAVIVPVVRSSPVRVVLGLVLALLAPGYATVAALFPDTTGTEATLDPVERLGLAVGVSVAISICWGVVLSATVGLHTGWIVGGLSVVTGAGAAVALGREGGPQGGTGDGKRLRPALTGWLDWSIGEDRRQAIRAGTLIAVLVVSLVAAGVLLSGVPRSAPTEVYLSDDVSAGQSAVDTPPTEFVVDEPEPVPVTIVNHASESRSYTAVYVLQAVEPGTRAREVPLNVTSERELQRVTLSVPGGESAVVDRSVAPSVSGESLRLVVRVYRGDSTGTEPAQTVHVWVTVDDRERALSPSVETERGESR